MVVNIENSIHWKEGWSWALQALSGVLLVLLLGAHWAAQHYLGSGGLRNYQDVVDYLRRPGIFALEAAFLFTVILHALLGVRAVLLDTGLSQKAGRWLNGVLILIGLVTAWYGISLAWSVLFN